MKLDIPKFETKKELFSYLKENVEDLIYQKKSEFKKADGLNIPIFQTLDSIVDKSDNTTEDAIKVKAIINTTMIRDSHKDVHINGLWKKSLSENKRIKHLQEHNMSFKNIISDKDDLQVSTKTYTWKELGFNFEGKTEALVFDSNVKKSRNPQMYKEYKEGNVDNHSVGMYYVKIKLAMNSDEEDYKEEKAEFVKNIDGIVNRKEVVSDGYYWAVYEAKAIEGSAVPMGSNPITPTLTSSKSEPTKEEIEVKTIKEWLQS